MDNWCFLTSHLTLEGSGSAFQEDIPASRSTHEPVHLEASHWEMVLVKISSREAEPFATPTQSCKKSNQSSVWVPLIWIRHSARHNRIRSLVLALLLTTPRMSENSKRCFRKASGSWSTQVWMANSMGGVAHFQRAHLNHCAVRILFFLIDPSLLTALFSKLSLYEYYERIARQHCPMIFSLRQQR